MSEEVSSASTSTRVPIFNIDDATPTLISVNMSNITKLTSMNYLTWRLQITALLEGHELHGFISETDQAPPPQVTSGTATIPNPKLKHWTRQDRLLYSAIIGTLSLQVQPMVSHAQTTREIWIKLAKTYGNPSRAHINQIRQQLKTISKGNQSVEEYMKNVVTKADKLALLGSPLPHEDLLDHITTGLDDDYRPIVELVNGRETPISIEELHEKLLNRENTLRTIAETTSTAAPASANMAQHKYNNNNNSSKPNQNQYYNNNNYGRGRGAGRGSQGRGYQGRCQICGIHGHSARTCRQLASPQWSPPSQYPPPPSPNMWNQSSPMPPPNWQPRAHYTASTNYSQAPWLLDSGATHHIATDISNMSIAGPYNGGEEVVVGNGAGLPITNTGSTTFPTPTKNLLLDNVLCVPTIKKNLISVNKLCRSNGVMVQMCPHDFQVKDLNTGATIIKGRANEGLYEWPTIPTGSSFVSAFSTSKTSTPAWHARLGHPANSIIQLISSRSKIPMSFSTLFNACSINKSHKLPFSQSSIHSHFPLDIVFSDVWTSPVHSIDGYKYYVIFVDHYTRYTWLYPLKQKSHVATIFPVFRALVEDRFKTKITTLYSDNGGEYIGLRSYLASHGISHLTSPPHTPEHNGIAERKHRHIVETGLSLLSHASIPIEYWSYSLAAAVFLINRMPTPILSNVSPYEVLFQSTPNYTRLRVFGCLCYPWLRPYSQHKLSPRSTPCIFFGYSLTQSAYLCYDFSTAKMFVSRHVEFHENEFPLSSFLSSTNTLHESSSSVFHPVSATRVYREPLITSSPPSLDPSPTTTEPIPSDSDSSPTENDNSASQETLNGENDEVIENPALAVVPGNIHPMLTRSKNNIQKPNRKFANNIRLEEIEPTSHVQALKDEHWRHAMGDEFDSIVRNGTFTLVDPRFASNVVGNRWIFVIKRKADGTIDRFKARLVAKGFHQRPGIDFQETFSPVIKHVTIRLVLGLAARKNWVLRQLDVNNAFLQGKLTEEVYMSQPPGFIDKDKPHYVCRLHKAIYGLKQAPRAWYNELRDFLLSNGFVNSLADASVFIFHMGAVIIYMLVYVDDIVLTGNSASAIDRFIQVLSNRFSLKDMGALSYFLGLEVTRSSAGIRLNQRKYTTDILSKYHMLGAKPVPTPMASSTTLTVSDGVPLPDPTEYRAAVGSLQYLALTRPDIGFAVNRLSQFMHSPTTVHWDAVKRVLRYLAGTVDHGLWFSANASLELSAYSDADWGGDKDDYSSTGAYIVYLGTHPISWSSKKQKGVSRSSTEAEYRAVTEAASEVKWVLSLLSELHIRIPTAPKVYCDNIGATYLCANPVFHSRMKHLALDYHFVRELIQAGVLRVLHVNSIDQLADGLTKPLPRARFQDLRFKIGVTNGSPS
ncbi:Reverse transcriptase RNA-dependent DNA polymerase [Arabidopsis suecica]|uniref:Reverse transcriptase RNA-dependent DNA polymerase n=1 Tax=Arabidopsis suecica TaxID=45249 RepID=A0A8T2CJ44_ARASU|nr:Reverse transcriptase RNA-dependent DNA polymerase [Arabidopsis suecica]